MIKKSLVLELVVLAIAAIWLNACSSSAATTGGSLELNEFVAQTIIDQQLELAEKGYKSPEGAIVAHVNTVETQGEPLSPVRIWRYSQGQLTDETTHALEKALDDDRSEWPSFTFVFSIVSATSTHATIDLHTYYNLGSTESSRGGNAQRWELEKQSDEWVVTNEEPYMFWD